MSHDDPPSDPDQTLPPWGADPPVPQRDPGSEPSTEAPIPLLAFDLLGVIGTGGEGEVWLGRHREQGVQVAVKVTRTQYANDAQFRTRFNAEVRAVAALQHRGIVSILDYGIIDELAQERSAGKLVEGCPYLVMEHAQGGDLGALLPLGSFNAFRQVMLKILDGLAHAHARGVVHRDIKPGNILVRGKNRGEPDLMLADFGIAFAHSSFVSPVLSNSPSMRLWREDQTPIGNDDQYETSASMTSKISVGTPSFMSPEQIHGDLNNQGPWTDLYAVGCLAYLLCTGMTPFFAPRRKTKDILWGHLYGEVPEPSLRFPAPVGFARWLSTLLAKAPWERFQRAADAARDLVALGDPTAPVTTEATTQASIEALALAYKTESDIDTMNSAGRTLPPQTVPIKTASGSLPFQTVRMKKGVQVEPYPTTPSPTVTSITPQAAPEKSQEPKPRPSPGPVRHLAPTRFPRTWRGDELSLDPIRLVGAGLDLFELRPVPFVGRDSERDLLWSVLGQVQGEQHPRLVTIHGSAGIGKSRLAQWVAQRADELGCAELLVATHDAFANGADGIPRMLARALRCQGLTLSEMRQQTRHVLHGLGPTHDNGSDIVEVEYLVMALTQLMEPCARPEDPGDGDGDGNQDGDGDSVGERPFASQTARFAAIQQLIRRKSLRRPVILWLDDVQWGRSTLELAAYLMASPDPAPTLILLTYRDEALEEQIIEPPMIKALTQGDHARELALSPLADHEQLDLVLGMLGLEPSLAQTVRQRTGGNPLFAIQLVGDWVDRRVLEVAQQGFDLRPGEQAGIPDDIHDLWKKRLNGLSSRFGPDAHRSLELAAALGTEVDASLWQQICDHAGQPIPAQMLERMVELHLVLDTNRGWRFANSLMRESLERTATDDGRWEGHHSACADVLLARPPDARSRRSEEIAAHLLAASRPAEGLAPLLSAARRHHRQANYPRALELCEMREAVCEQLSVDPGDLRYRQGWLLQADVYFQQGDFDTAERLLDRAEAHATEGDADPTRAGLLQTRARVMRMRGDLRRALDLSEQASGEFRRLKDELGASACDLITARLHFESTGDHRRGLDLVRAAEARFRDAGDENNLGETLYITALLHQALGDEETALEDTAQARAHYRTAGNRFGEAACENFLGEVARQASEFERAEKNYVNALRLLESLGSKWTYIQRVNIALTLVQSGQYNKAERQLQALREEEGEGRDAIACYRDYAFMACAANQQRWKDWDRYYEASFAARPDTGRVDKDLAELALIAGTVAARHGMSDRARRALKLSRAHWKALDTSDRVTALDKQLAELE
jgi:eukaryotic-like serine/threonine-protein kinase